MKRKVIILIVILSLLFLYFITQKENFNSQEDLIFFKLWNSQNKNSQDISNIQNKKTSQYKIEVSKGIKKYNMPNLWTTIDTKTLVNEKIAPGTKGNFEIILYSNCDIKYKIEFKGKNGKPKNFELNIQEGYTGEIKENETKILHARLGVEIQYKF